MKTTPKTNRPDFGSKQSSGYNFASKGRHMKKSIIAIALVAACFTSAFAQVKPSVLVQIVKAEDARRYDKTLETLLASPDAAIRKRAALAAGRIGNDAAVPVLSKLLLTDPTDEVRIMAAFALGEIESIKASGAIIDVLGNTKLIGDIRARAVEAAGKIAAANAKDPMAKELGNAIVGVLRFENGRRSMPHEGTILLGVTAVLRARPEGGDAAVANFLDYSSERVRADSANTLTRLRSKVAVEQLRKMLADNDANVRSNVIRALGAAEDKDSLPAFLKAAASDADSRVRVSAIRAVGGLKDKGAAAKLIERGNVIIASIPQGPKTAKIIPSEKNELLEIVTAVSRLLPGTNDENALSFVNTVRQIDNYGSSETEIAFARIAPKKYVEMVSQFGEGLFAEDWRTMSAVFQGLGEIADAEKSPENDAVKSMTRVFLIQMISLWLNGEPKTKRGMNAQMAVPSMLNAFAAFKSENTSGIMRPILELENDIYIRATIAGILADQPASKENLEALQSAFTKSMLGDKTADDATLALMDAMYKVDKQGAVGSLLIALNSSDFLVRKKALALLGDKELYKDAPGIPTMLENAYNKKNDQLSEFAIASKLGVLLNTNADYLRAVSRKNGSVKAILNTTKGAFTIEFTPEDAPLTVDNWVKLARAGYFNGLSVHRVVPNFVMQDGDPRGDGEGGPGWQIRCEVNMLEYDRGAVGMALSGKDTGGSQWFATHSPQPHLDGGYTVFGRVDETGMKVVDQIVRGDRILSVKIVEKRQATTRRRK